MLTAEDHLLFIDNRIILNIERIRKHESITLQLFCVSQDVESTIEILLEKGVDVPQLLPAMIKKGWLKVAMQPNQ